MKDLVFMSEYSNFNNYGVISSMFIDKDVTDILYIGTTWYGLKKLQQTPYKEIRNNNIKNNIKLMKIKM